MKIGKTSNGALFVTIPKSVAEQLNWKKGDVLFPNVTEKNTLEYKLMTKTKEVN